MTTLLQTFDALPAAERAEIFRLLRLALLNRGGTMPLGNIIAVTYVQDIAQVFARNGCEIEEYS